MTEENPLHRKLESARRDLLDLTTRNRLISTARTSTRSSRLEIVNERSEEIFRILVTEGKAMAFLPDEKINEATSDSAGEEKSSDNHPLLFQPAERDILDEDEDENELTEHHIDLHLQTSLADEILQRRLLKLYYDARTSEEEQGVSILYLALGFLKWYEDEKSDRPRYAPLLLVPAQLDRRSASSRFRLRYTDNDLATNLSLQEKLKADFGLNLPDVPEIEDLSPENYFAEVTQAIESKPRWEVLPNDVVLWFFSFSKFLMYRDLQPDTWPAERQIENHPLVSGLLDEGFQSEPPICSDDENIDQFLQPLDMIHVMDADSSQTLAIEEVKRGRQLVIQGPPGTGKSQTITNLIATAVKDGKKVLFVSEKMAALEVVKRRLDNIGLGEMCLELHSHKSNKRAVLEELNRVLKLGQPKVGDIVSQAEELATCRSELNRHSKTMHTFLEPSQITPFQAVGELVRLRAKGVAPVDFSLVDCLSWTSTEMRGRQSLLADLTVQLREIGNPVEQPWRGVQLEAILPNDATRFAARIPDILNRAERLIAVASQLGEIFEQECPETALDASKVAIIGKRLLTAPPMDQKAIGDSVWGNRHDEINDLITLGETLSGCQQSLAETVVEVGWTTDVARARRSLAAYGNSWFRIFRSDYREAQATLRGILTGPAPKPLAERIRILDDLIRGQNALKTIRDDSSTQEIGTRAFGSYWRGEKTDWAAIRKISNWETECRDSRMPDNIRQLVGKVDDLNEIGSLVKKVGQDLKPLLSELHELFTSLALNVSTAFAVSDEKQIPLRDLVTRLTVWRADPDSVTKWITYFIRWKNLESQGLGELAKRIDEGVISANAAVDCFQMAYYEELMREAFCRFSDLASFDGSSHEQTLSRFKKLDTDRLLMARQEVAMAHFQGLPNHGSDAGEVGVLRKQMKLKRRHYPLRKLLQRAGHAVQAIKPVFMLSPISIAQFLEPGVLEFDLLVFDEASQVRPVDALGAIARTRQVVVVGDEKQLPPTRFFGHVAGDDGDKFTDDDDFQTSDVESVLGLCEAQNMSQRMLRWHYRSRHHSLIAVSNHEFYENRLYVIPSPTNGEEGDGLRFRNVPDGIYDRGGSKTNRVEAAAIAEAVMDHARRFSDVTLGVGAFSVSQRDAILDELELRRRNAPELEPFFATGTTEPFFVKNLENIQGDERAVIFISVGYGKDSSGYMGMNFGPLNNEGGERRLNVLITRARERCEVFSSITANDIDLNRTQSRGVRALKTFLTFAKSGHLDVGERSGRDFDSEFEREVANGIKKCGFEVHTQVGVAGFFIDLAIVDPDCPGRYLLGIECDGASYHSSRSARDRDRLRQQVLEDRGWVIHRIWSTDWFRRPDKQLRKIQTAIEHAKVDWATREDFTDDSIVTEEKSTAVPEVIDRLTVELDTDESQGPVASIPYTEASFQVRTNRGIHEVDSEQLSRVVTNIVQIEGPVHQDEITRRAASLWGLQRTGRRIAASIKEALAFALHKGDVVQAGLFFRHIHQELIPIRNRDDVLSRNLRKPEYLPNTEIQAALKAVVAAHFGISREELAREVAKLFGFRSASSAMKQIFEGEIELLITEDLIESRNHKMYSVKQPTKPITE